MRLIKTFNLLSIDVAIGAFVSAAFFARVLDVTVLPQGYILLALIVWLIYTADHLLDAWYMKQDATTERHLFHQKNFRTILVCFCIGGLIALALMFVIRVQLIATGIVLGIFVITYLVVNRWLKYFKELTGTLLYTGGVLLPAWSMHTDPISTGQMLIIISFGLIALSNMLIFAALSREQDTHNNQRSLATVLGDSTMSTLIRIVVGTCIFLIACVGMIMYASAETIPSELIVLITMEATLVVVYEAGYFRRNDRYRIFGDGVFLFPIVLFI